MAGTPKQGYWLNGKRIPSVTTIISNCKMGGIEPLLIWANKCGQEGNSHRDVANRAADAGTCAHDMIECDIRNQEFNPEAYDYDALDTAKPCFDAYLKWKEQMNLKVRQAEVKLISEKYGYGGTMDALATGDALVLGDWKTSNAIYPDYVVQLAAYKQLWEENYPDEPITGGAYLLRVNKQKEPDDPISFSYHYWENLDLGWETFQHMLEIYRLHKRLKGIC